jgi:hypothetical protein
MDYLPIHGIHDAESYWWNNTVLLRIGFAAWLDSKTCVCNSSNSAEKLSVMSQVRTPTHISQGILGTPRGFHEGFSNCLIDNPKSPISTHVRAQIFSSSILIAGTKQYFQCLKCTQKSRKSSSPTRYSISQIESIPRSSIAKSNAFFPPVPTHPRHHVSLTPLHGTSQSAPLGTPTPPHDAEGVLCIGKPQALDIPIQRDASVARVN